MKYLMSMVAFLALTFTEMGLQAQILFKNNQKESVMVAFAYYSAQSKTWITEGWFTLNPGTATNAFPTIKEGDSIGYWAMTNVSETVFSGNRPLLVHNDEKFNIRKADQQPTASAHPEFEWRNFRMIRLPKGVTSGTISLDK